MSFWHDNVENYISVPFFIVIISGLIVKHEIVHVLLVGQRVHHEELSTDLLKVLFVVIKLDMEKAFEIVV